MFERLLGELRERAEGTQAVALVDGDGMIVASAGEGGEGLEILAAAAVEFGRRAGALASEAAAGTLQGVIVQGDAATVVLQPVAGGYALVARMGAEGLLGRLRYELRRAAARIRPELER